MEPPWIKLELRTCIDLKDIELAFQYLVFLNAVALSTFMPAGAAQTGGLKMPKKMSFDEAKAKQLKDVVRGRSWTQMMDDRDADMYVRAIASMTPQYLAIWKRAAKETDAENNQ